MFKSLYTFQWQNPFLRAKIYPLREKKLADFLLIYKEADLVQESKPLPQAERETFVKAKLEAYRQELSDLDHHTLLQKVVERLDEKDKEGVDRFEPWMRYMVIHFSGMRYESAHGSYRDPRNLLVVMENRAFEERRKQLMKFQPADLDRDCPAAISAMEQSLQGLIDPLQRKVLETQLTRLRNPTQRLGAYIKYETSLHEARVQALQALPEEEAVGRLEEEGPTAQKKFIGWAWDEIVRLTPARLKYVTQKNAEGWDKLNFQGKLTANKDNLSMFNNWELMGAIDTWRLKHQGDYSLVVIRAVCNEVSEHVHHMRGYYEGTLKPGGGLTGRPKWYLNLEQKANPPIKKEMPGKKDKSKKKEASTKDNQVPDEDSPLLPAEGPYLRRPLDATYFKKGGSILWLNWVSIHPTEWQITLPVGDFNFKQGNDPSWTYDTEIGKIGTEFVRLKPATSSGSTPQKPVKAGESKKTKLPQIKQWLRWSHEAIVFDIVELLSGVKVLTFETENAETFPSKSEIGLNIRHLSNLVPPRNRPPLWHVFAAFVPERTLDDFHKQRLERMLDRQTILAPEPEIPAEFAAPALAIAAPTPALAPAAGDIQERWQTLTRRQKQVVTLVCLNLSTRQIATQLDTSTGTVQTHLSKAMKKMGVSSRQELIARMAGFDFGEFKGYTDSSF